MGGNRQGIAIKGKLPAGIVSFKKIIERGMASSAMVPESMKLSAMVRELIEATSYREMLEEENSIESRSRLENIEEFVNSVFTNMRRAIPMQGSTAFCRRFHCSHPRNRRMPETPIR